MPQRYIGYVLALVIAVAGIVAGISSRSFVTLGLAAGFLVVSIWLIIRRENVSTPGSDDTFWAIFEVSNPLVWLGCLLIEGAGVGLARLIFP